MKMGHLLACWVLVFSCCVFIHTASAFGAPYTEAAIEGHAGVSPLIGPTTDPHTISRSNNDDFANGLWDGTASAEASALYGASEVSASITSNYNLGWLGPRTITGDQEALYNLSWSTQNNQSGSIINISMSGSGTINDTLTADLQFIYGVPYEIKSVLDVNSTTDGFGHPSYARAVSTWDDTITFYGKPEGSLAIASFVVNLDGSITETNTEGIGPGYSEDDIARLWSFNGYEIDFGSVLSNIDLPCGSWIVADSGTNYPVSEPTTMLLLASGLVGLAGLRRKFREY